MYNKIKENIKLIDVSILDIKHTTGCYLIKTGKTNILIDCGPDSQLSKLNQQLKNYDITINDIDYVLPTHIHLDHAGSAWQFAKLGAKIYLHPFGAKHLINPTKFFNSFHQIYQEKTELLWGDFKPIKADHVVVVEDKQKFEFDDLVITAHFSPGHAKHHIVWQIDDILFSGDALGCKHQTGPILAPTPPPDIDYDLWIDTINNIKELKIKHAYLTHYGRFDFTQGFIDELLASLSFFKEFGKELYEKNYQINQFIFNLPDGIEAKYDEVIHNTKYKNIYQMMAPNWMNCQGAIFYWKKKLEKK